MGRPPNSSFFFSLQPNSHSSNPPDFLIPFDFGRPFFYRISYLSPLFSTLQTQTPPLPHPPIIQTIKMRFSIVAAAVMASVVAADTTYYSTTSTTVIDTITSCGPEVTNCPARSHSSSPAVATYTPVVYSNSSASASAPYVAPTYPVSSPAAPVYPVSSPVSLATSYITTCIPTVITSVYTVSPTPSGVASATAGMTYAKNATTPYATATPSQYVTGAASNVQGSMVLAAAAGVAAFLFA